MKATSLAVGFGICAILFAIISFSVQAYQAIQKDNTIHSALQAKCDYWKEKVRNPVVISDTYRQTDDWKLWISNPTLWQKYSGYATPQQHFHRLDLMEMRANCTFI